MTHQTTAIPRRDIRGYSCPDCGLCIHEDDGPWDERYLEEPDAEYPCLPGCPQCPYQVMMEPVWLTVRPRVVVAE